MLGTRDFSQESAGVAEHLAAMLSRFRGANKRGPCPAEHDPQGLTDEVSTPLRLAGKG